MKVKITVYHYGPSGSADLKFANTSKIRVTIESDEDEDFFASGYIDNPFPIVQFGSEHMFEKQTFSGTILKNQYAEASNGGRTNETIYDSIQDYLKDPVVKERVKQKCLNGFDLSPGDPDNVDEISTFVFDDFPETFFEIEQRSWDNVIPAEWYTEIYAKVISELDTYDVWENAGEAIDNTSTVDDLFGDRAFPVIRAPKALLREMRWLADNFKNCSNPLVGEEYVYIGLRAKPYEISNIAEIYEHGGSILKDKIWDW